MDQKLFSVIILCYDQTDYLPAALDSVLCQSYENIELIISDDASAYFPQNQIQTHISQKKRDNISKVTIRKENENVGIVKHLNHVLPLCHGDYIVVLSADDTFCDENVLSKYVSNFEAMDPDCCVQLAQVSMYDESLKRLQYYYITPGMRKVIEAATTNQKELLYTVLQFGDLLPSVGLCYKKEFFEVFGDFDERFTHIQGYPMYLRIAKENIHIGYSNFVAVKHRFGGLFWDGRNASRQTLILVWKDLRKVNQDILKNDLSILPIKRRQDAVSRAKWQLRCADAKLVELEATPKNRLLFLLHHPCLAFRFLLNRLYPLADKCHISALKLWLMFLFFSSTITQMLETVLDVSSDRLILFPFVVAALSFIVWALSFTVWLLQQIFYKGDLYPPLDD